MRCPFCHSENNSRVLNTRPTENGEIRRVRECIDCERTFKTLEYVVLKEKKNK